MELKIVTRFYLPNKDKKIFNSLFQIFRNEVDWMKNVHSVEETPIFLNKTIIFPTFKGSLTIDAEISYLKKKNCILIKFHTFLGV